MIAPGAHGAHVAELVRYRRQVAELGAALIEVVGLLDSLDGATPRGLDEDADEVLERLRGIVNETRKWVE